MKKTKHETFLQELCTPILNMEKTQRSRKAAESNKTRSSGIEDSRSKRPEASASGENSDLMAELEAKFDALFGNLDDDDD